MILMAKDGVIRGHGSRRRFTVEVGRAARPGYDPPGPRLVAPDRGGPGAVSAIPAPARGREIGARPQILGTEAAPITIMMRNDSALMILVNSDEIESFSRGHPASTSCRRPSLLGVGVIGDRRSPGPRRRGRWMCALKIRKT